MGLRYILLVATLLVAAGCLSIFALRAGAIWRAVGTGKGLARFDGIFDRLIFTAGQVLGHRRLMRKPLSGILHFFIFSGFLVLILDVVETIGELLHPSFSLGPILDGVVDTWLILVLAGVALAFYNRLVLRPERFHGSDETDGYIILGLIATIMVGIVIHESFYPFLAGLPPAAGHFLGTWVGGLWFKLGWNSPGASNWGYAIGYTLDMGVILGFLAYLPYSKHFHIFTAIPNIFFRKTSPPGELLPRVPADSMAVRSYSDMFWKDLLDLFTCTECGRCQEACPAQSSGAPLSPKMVILELRDNLASKLGNGGGGKVLAQEVVGSDALWACTTCGACQEVCPVFIDHAPKISGLRAALLEDGEVDQGAQKALVALDRQGNSFGQPSRRRAGWISGLDFPVPDARKEEVDLLWFLGDYAAYDQRAQENTKLVARLLHEAGVSFGILFEGEVNSGNDCLRMGEYGLFESLAEKNIKALEGANYNRIFTTDPHSLNALRNEYRKFGFDRPVLHYTEILLEMAEEGTLSLHPLGVRATYHDPCYLGRWNRIFDAPRKLLGRCGVEVVEMPRHGEFSFCCGAGGGRIWMGDAGSGERPVDQRLKEALALPEVTHLAVACPKDVAMFSAAASAMGDEDRLRVVDVAALVYAASGLKEKKESG